MWTVRLSDHRYIEFAVSASDTLALPGVGRRQREPGNRWLLLGSTKIAWRPSGRLSPGVSKRRLRTASVGKSAEDLIGLMVRACDVCMPRVGPPVRRPIYWSFVKIGGLRDAAIECESVLHRMRRRRYSDKRDMEEAHERYQVARRTLCSINLSTDLPIYLIFNQ